MNNKRNWKLIDQRKGEIFCDSPYSYFVDNPKFYSQFKIRNDLNSCDEKYIIMHSLEFHGVTTFQTLSTIMRKIAAPSFLSSYLAIFFS